MPVPLFVRYDHEDGRSCSPSPMARCHDHARAHGCDHGCDRAHDHGCGYDHDRGHDHAGDHDRVIVRHDGGGHARDFLESHVGAS